MVIRLLAGQSRNCDRIPGMDKRFFLHQKHLMGLGSTQPPTQWVPGTLYPGIKWLGHEGNPSPPPNAMISSDWSYTPTPHVPS